MFNTGISDSTVLNNQNNNDNDNAVHGGVDLSAGPIADEDNNKIIQIIQVPLLINRAYLKRTVAPLFLHLETRLSLIRPLITH